MTSPAPTSPAILNYERLEAMLSSLRSQWSSAKPFSHVLIDDFLEKSAAERALAEFPRAESDDWVHYTHVNEKKFAQTKRSAIPDGPGIVIDELNSLSFISWLGRLTGIQGLLPDPELQGGGLHQSRKGGFLNIHADFTSHPHRQNWQRRINALIYLNPGWEEGWGGALGLWDKTAKVCVKTVLPVFNRCLIFATDTDSFHGHPDPLRCPDNVTRKSMALYYFTEAGEKPLARSTEYRSQPTDSSAKKAMIYADKMALRLFDRVKRRLGISDAAVAKILKKLFK